MAKWWRFGPLTAVAVCTGLVPAVSSVWAQQPGARLQESGGRDAASLIAEGEDLYGQLCAQCHALEEGENRLGPTLHGVFGREAGGLDEFAYSAAMEEADIVWHVDTLNPFIADPEGLVPGNAMPFMGLEEPDDRQAIIAFLEDVVGPDDAGDGQGSGASGADDAQGAMQPDTDRLDPEADTAGDPQEGGGQAEGGDADTDSGGNRTEGLRTPGDVVSPE